MQRLEKKLGFAHGLALYLAAVLGTGILIVPLLAWQDAGPASMIAWITLGFLGFALAWTFATVGAQMPDAGGIQAMIGRVFGPDAATFTKYLVFFSVPAGAVPGAYIFAYHVCAAFLLPDQAIPYLAIGAWVLVAALNYFGLRISAGAQLVLSALLVLLLTAFVLFAFPLVRSENFVPFAPNGLNGIGTSALIIFWSFLGWEAIAHLSEEFHNPKRDMIRCAVTAACIVGVFYLAITYILIGVGIFNGHAGQNAPLVQLATRMFGVSGRLFTGILAAVICLGTMNAYMAGLSRLAYSMAREGDLPAFLARLDFSTGTPKSSVLFLLILNVFAISIQLLFHLSLHGFFLVQNVAFLLLYVFGCLSAARLLAGNKFGVAAALVSAFICAAMLLFASKALLYPAILAAAAIGSILLKRRRNRSAPPEPEVVDC